jgi:CheY-like chemotaxis protein
MPTKVLIFENDSQFAADLARALRSAGTETTVVEDPSQGLQIAANERPQLIVLSVELHKMNGFSVCNRIKKEPTLANVPVILTTSNSTDATIEQHRQRPNHADEYIRKPVTVDALIERIGNYVSLGRSVRPSAIPNDDDIVIDDDIIEMNDEKAPSVRPRRSLIPVDSDMSSFADEAFEGLMTEPERPSRPAPSRPAPSRPSRAPVAAPSSPGSIAPASSEATKVRLLMLQNALDEANAKIEELRSQDNSAKDHALERLRKELDDANAKLLVSGRGAGGGSSAREVLDLREQLHKKEKELLDLRDKVTQREKEVLSLKDSSLSIEREKADMSDKLDDIARQLTETQRHVEAARADKEAANKRNEDAKRRVEKLTLQLEERAQEIDSIRTQFGAAQQENAAVQAELREAQQATEQHAAEELRTAMARASAEINLQAEKAQKLLESTVAQKDDERKTALERAEQEKAGALQSLEQRLVTEHDAALAQLRSEHENALHHARDAQAQELQGLRDAQAQELQGLRDAHTQELQGLRDAHAQEIASLKNDHENERKRQTDAQTQEIQSLRDQHAGATQRLRDEHSRSEQAARDAHQSALEQLSMSHEAMVQKLNQEHESFVHNLRTEHETLTRQAQSERELSEQKRDERIYQLERELDASNTANEEAGQRIQSLEGSVARAQSKYLNDKGDIDRIKDALASIVVHLDGIEGRTLD